MCSNKNCPHRCKRNQSSNGCALFPGLSVLGCRGFKP